MKKALTVGLHIRHKARLHGRLTDVEFATAGSSDEALEILQADDDFSLLVVDEKLTDSELFLQRVKAMEIPTIYCADGEKSSGFLRSLVVDLDVSVVLVKPVDPDELVRKAGELLAAERVTESDDDSVDTQMRARLAALWEKFGPANLERIQWLKEQVEDVLDEEEKDEAARREMEREAHKMVGALGTFGFPKASVLAREIELHVAPSKTMAALDGNQLMQWVQGIEAILKEGPQGSPKAPADSDGTRILVVSEKTELIEQVKSFELNGQSVQVETATTWSRARESWFLKAPDLVLLDLCDDHADERRTLLNSLAAKLSTIPVLVLLPQEVWSQPDALARYSGFPVLFDPYEDGLLKGTLSKLLSEQDRPKPKVLAVDDDPQILDALKVLLAPLKLEITTLSDPLEFWDTLERTEPDLLMLDLDMPYLSGLEICRGVRSSPRWWELPVLFLSASSDEENLNRLYTVGADDFVPKPFAGAELATRVVNRLVRSTGASFDKGRADFQAGLDGLRTILAETEWEDNQVLVALVTVKNDGDLMAKLGASATSQLNQQFGVRLADKLRGKGAVARWKQQEFVVCMPAQALDVATEELKALLNSPELVVFNQGDGGEVRFEAGAGITIMDNPNWRLEAALRKCQRGLKFIEGSAESFVAEKLDEEAAGQAQAPVEPDVSESKPPEAKESCQILVLEADAETGERVQSLLAERGHDVRWESEPEAAIAKLTAQPPDLAAKAVFISSRAVELLPQLSSVTEHSNVVVAVNSEQELTAAFDGGAFDCIEKPCHAETVIKRISRACLT